MFEPSLVAVPAYRLNGTTSGCVAVIAAAASRMSCQVFGSHGTAIPAASKTEVRYQIARVSVPSETA